MDEFHTPALVTVDPTANLNGLLATRVTSSGDQPLMERKDDAGVWTPITAREFDSQVVALAEGLVSQGIDPGDHIGIMSRTRYEWSLIDWAIWAAGAVTVPLYETSSAEQVEWILTDSGVRLLVVENADNAATVAEVRASAPRLSSVHVIDDGGLDALVASGEDVPDSEIARRRSLARLTDLATVIYTSGTTGRPKGAELTHENFYSVTVNATAKLADVLHYGRGRTLLFMPLAHVFARFIHVLVVPAGSVLGHTSDAKDLLPDLASFKPSYVLSVPRVFEKVYNSAGHKAAADGKGKIFNWAAATAITYSRALDKPSGPGTVLKAQHKLADLLVLRRIRAVLGGEVRHAVSGGAPLGERLGHFFRGVGLIVLEGYGLTETTAPTSVNLPERSKIGTVGPPLPGHAVRVDLDGEILVKGPHVFRGYRNNPEASAEAFDHGWFRTGDIGSLDPDGYLRITGRKKEIIVTAGGKNVAPAVLEDRLRSHPLISQVVVVGDGQPFIGALVTLDPEGIPGWLIAHGKEPMSFEEALTDTDVLTSVDAAVQRANRAVSRAESIRRFTVLPADFTVANGYLTPSLKVKRLLVMQDFADEVGAIFATPKTVA
jgi:long-chain acyl-CoA synthetase